MPQYTDQLQRSIDIPSTPQRIISLVPSLTELLFDLGLGDRVVGITKFCIHPEEWFRSKTRVGGTKQLKHEVIAQLQPDLIIANKEENTRADVEALMPDYPVWVSDVNTLEEALDMMQRLGEITETREKAGALVSEIQESFKQLATLGSQRVLYLIWQKPWMAAGRDNFVHEMLECCGWENVVQDTRYPELSDQEIRELDPEIVMLSSEPFPFQEKHIDSMQTLLPNAKVILVDGEMFSWYGSRLRYSAAYFQQLLHSTK
ncbi:ABC transporter substrate-binding protein [Reichenbachiella ulvae]|uniref:Helical backbone metal receptor n=1 Tax=Reichenbachiella ulvae TaxID=2980104 RepID=A0ABT3CVL9_9BACT|nr:helical backbone metal receptor [Reichenbachiella ulvae]MCV9387631.1 helical backbone metal receptor [Reichenbachiella ulvae]